MSPYYIWFTIFIIVAYFIATDNSVAKLVYLLSQLVRVEYEKIKWKIMHDPQNPIVKWLIWRRSYKLAKQLQKDLNNKNK